MQVVTLGITVKWICRVACEGTLFEEVEVAARFDLEPGVYSSRYTSLSFILERILKR